MHEGDDDLEGWLSGDAAGHLSAGAGGSLHFQPGLIIRKGGPLAALAEEVFQSIPAPPITPGRKPRQDAMARRRSCVDCLLANLAVLALCPARRNELVTPTENVARDRYNAAPFNSVILTATLQALEMLGLVEIRPGAFKRRCTTVSATPGLTDALKLRGVSLSELDLAPGTETILRRAPRGRQAQRGELVAYVDGIESRRLRQDMDTINGALSGGEVRLDGHPVAPIHMVRIFLDDGHGGWGSHGRLYRGEPWLSLPKKERHRLTIGGEELVDLDYSACFLRLAYIKQGLPFPKGDPYAIPGLEGHRDSVKRLMASLFFRSSPPERLPKGIKGKLPEGWTMGKFLEAATAHHPGIAPLFGTQAGWEFFAMESRVMVKVLLRLIKAGVIALPCHDGALAPQSASGLVVETMRQTSKELLGWELPVAEKPIWRPTLK